MTKVACISDIHLGHKRNRVGAMVDALKKAFPDNAETADLDVIFLAGDVFDRLLDLPNDCVTEIDLWIAHLIKVCSKHDIALRILEGTPSHDWKQSVRFEIVQELLGCPIDMQYVRTLHVEYMDKLGIHVLYVPDEWDTSTDKTLHQVKELIKAKGIDKVDYAIMHGNFTYQLPAAAKSAPRHDERSYLNLVRHLIFIGHVHVYSNFERIYAQGSFDRLSHGEEGPKGHLRADVEKDGTYRVTFIENKAARKYITLKCADLSLEDFLEVVKKAVSKLPEDSCVRIEGESTHPIMSDMNSLVRMYPLIVWSKLVKDKEEEALEIISEEQDYVPITIDRDNVMSLLFSRPATEKSSPAVLDNARRHLLELI